MSEVRTPEATRDHDVVVDVSDLSVHFDLRGSNVARLLGRDTGTVKAVDGVDLSLRRGEVVGLVGESGSGKSTLGRALLGLVPATSGTVEVEGRDVATMRRRELRELRRDIQMVFQDPNAALNPAMTVGQAVGDGARIAPAGGQHRQQRGRRRAHEQVAPLQCSLPHSRSNSWTSTWLDSRFTSRPEGRAMSGGKLISAGRLSRLRKRRPGGSCRGMDQGRRLAST